MVLAQIRELIFKKDVHKHTIYYAEHCENLSFKTPNKGAIKCVIANTYDEAVEKLRIEMRKYLKSTAWETPKFEDFRFKISYEEVDPEGYVWIQMSTTRCSEYEVI